MSEHVSNDESAEGLTEIERRELSDWFEANRFTTLTSAVERILADRLATVEAEVEGWRFRCEQHDRRRAEVERVLDDVLGPEEDDGAGEGLVADVALLAARAKAADRRGDAIEVDRDTARREADDLRVRLAAVEALEPTWPRGMYGCPDDMFSRRDLRAALADPTAAHVAEVSGEGL